MLDAGNPGHHIFTDDKDVFNGDIGRIADIDPEEQELVVRFEGRDVVYDFNELDELAEPTTRNSSTDGAMVLTAAWRFWVA